MSENTEAPPKYQRLLELMAEVQDLEMASAVLYWDQQTLMPKGGAKARSEQQTTLRRLAHQSMTSPEVGNLLADLAAWEESLPYDSDEASMIRAARRQYDQATRIPAKLVVESSDAASHAFEVWMAARAAKDFRVFLPALERIIDLSRQRAEALGYKETPMDALVDQHEPDLTVSKLELLFDELRAGLVPLAKAIFAQADDGRAAPVSGRFDHAKQLEMGLAAVRAIGFDIDARGRQALSVHPFSISFSPDDTRITTRVKEDQVGASLFGLLHEAGHGTYMQGIPERLRRTVLHEGASSGLHESQSRLWENIVGRSRYFWQFFLPIAKAYFPAQFGNVEVEAMYRAVNIVRPSLIRVEADEVTYNLHIMIRFELEKDVFAGKLAPKDLPDAWAAKFESYLGITPPDDLLGVLQDIHWTGGFGGSFQSYTIGNVTGVALYRKALAANPGMLQEWARGDFRYLLHWMQDNVHIHGRKFTPEELMVRATGLGLTAGPYLEHIRAKYAELYAL
jgi:carboxypeptidase Taq